MNPSVRPTVRWILGLAVLATLGLILSSYVDLRQSRAPDAWRKYLRSDEAYVAHRERLVAAMQSHSFSADLRLTAAETNVDNFLNFVRSNETTRFKTAGNFPPSRMFFEARTNIQNSRLFPILKKMPKGGLLHVHDSSSGRCEFVLTNIARRADCHIYWTTNRADGSRGMLKFTNAPPVNDGVTGYFPVNALRERLRQQGVPLDDELRRLYTLESSDPRTPDIWSAFGQWFNLLPDLIRYRPVFRDYLRDAFTTMHEDGISHVEIRAMAPVATMFDFTPAVYTEEDSIREYVAARDYIRANFNTNFSLKLIMTGYRGGMNSDASNVVAHTRRYRKTFPDLIVGCDWVGEEDGGLPTADEVPFLRAIAADTNAPIKFYFHDGETAWPGNDNLVDAVLLGTQRIGHGFNLFQLPTGQARNGSDYDVLALYTGAVQEFFVSPAAPRVEIECAELDVFFGHLGTALVFRSQRCVGTRQGGQRPAPLG